ncbi:MAG TPA: HAD-IA family hydrolase [Streptosporangiaceae bacterium]
MRRLLTGAGAVIADWDGTIADTREMNYRTLAAELACRGRALDRGWYDQHAGLAIHDLLAALPGNRPLPVAEIVAGSRRRLLAGASELKPIPGTLQLLRRARTSGLPCAIASGATRQLVHAGLDSLGLSEMFTVVVTREDVADAKPDPALYLEAARRLDVPAARCLAIDDAPDGIAAALAAGMTVLTVKDQAVAPVSMSCPVMPSLFGPYLRHALPAPAMAEVRAHLDSCECCWQEWNRYRWDAAAGTAIYEQMRAFLGSSFTPYLDSSRALAARWRQAGPSSEDQVRAFYRQEKAYLYNLVIWEASGNRPRYLDHALPHLTDAAITTIADYGCGTGSDTIALREHGFTVTPVELPSPHADFARWRMRRAGQPDTIIDPRDVADLPPVDTLWIIDTLDHLPDLHRALSPLLTSVCMVVTENLANNRAHGSQGFHHRRRPADIEAVFAQYGLCATAVDPDDPLICWRKP